MAQAACLEDAKEARQEEHFKHAFLAERLPVNFQEKPSPNEEKLRRWKEARMALNFWVYKH